MQKDRKTNTAETGIILKSEVIYLEWVHEIGMSDEEKEQRREKGEIGDNGPRKEGKDADSRIRWQDVPFYEDLESERTTLDAIREETEV